MGLINGLKSAIKFATDKVGNGFKKEYSQFKISLDAYIAKTPGAAEKLAIALRDNNVEVIDNVLKEMKNSFYLGQENENGKNNMEGR